VDGIKLLQLMRQTTTANDTTKQSPAGRRKRGRSKGGSSGSINNNYDGKDEYDLMATIIDGIESSRNSASSSSSRRIVTPTDQAIQYMDAIHSCISYLETNDSNNVNNVNNDGPTSLNDIPVILLTAKAMISDRIIGYGAGADGYLPKPFRPEELLGMVDNLLRRQQRREQSRKDDDVRQRRQQQQQGQQQQQQYELNNNGGLDDQGIGIIECLTPEQAREITNELIKIKKSIIRRQTGSSGGDSRIGTLFTRSTEDEEEELLYQHYQTLLPQSLWMYRTGERRKRIFTREHIYSILVLCYNMEITSLTTNKKKNVGWDVLYKELYERYLECPERCDLTTQNLNYS
jgi:CheY-like chemotaxis protein